MKVIIPLAGKGTRLRPHTHLVPKPLLKIAGKPVVQYVVEDLKKLGGVEEVIYITGHLKDTVEDYVRKNTPWKSVFIEQKQQRGTADAIALAKPYVDQPVMVIFVDTIFDADLGLIPKCQGDGIIWVKTVEDYKRFGVVVADKNNHMQKIIEKPDTPVSKRANIGLYYLKNWKLFYEGVDHVMKQPPNKGEYYLTDAFQYMVDKGAKLDVVDVEGWHDAGKIDTILETQKIMLEKRKMARKPSGLSADAKIIEPVYIEDGVTIRRSTVGPNVSVGKGTVIEDSTVTNSIVGEKCTFANARLHDSLIGDEVVVRGFSGQATLGDHCDLSGETA